jgi:ACR3 family arsenite transporter
MTFLANTSFADNPQYVAGLILLGLSPCTAMVMWWMFLARGDMAQGLINTAFNALLMLFLYAPLAALYLGVSSIRVPWDLIAVSVLVFITLPVASGALSRRVTIRKKGVEWFKDKYNPVVGKISIVALLLTLIVLFSFEGQTIINNPLLVWLPCHTQPNTLRNNDWMDFPHRLSVRLEVRERHRHNHHRQQQSF